MKDIERNENKNKLEYREKSRRIFNKIFNVKSNLNKRLQIF